MAKARSGANEGGTNPLTDANPITAESISIPNATYAHSLSRFGKNGISIINAPINFPIPNS